MSEQDSLNFASPILTIHEPRSSCTVLFWLPQGDDTLAEMIEELVAWFGVMAVFMPLSSTRGAPRDRALKAAGVVPEYIDLAMIWLFGQVGPKLRKLHARRVLAPQLDWHPQGLHHETLENLAKETFWKDQSHERRISTRCTPNQLNQFPSHR